MTREMLEKECVSVKDERLDDLFQQARKVNGNVYVSSVPKVRKVFRWSNPFHPAVEEYDEYVMYRIYPDGRVLQISHDYNSLKSYFIGLLEGYNIACNVARRKYADARMKKRT